MDYYNEQFPDKKKLLLRIYPFCSVQFSSKAASLRYRRHHHPRKKTKKDTFDDIDLEIDRLQQLKIEQISRVIHHDEKQYLVEFEDGTMECVELSNENKFVTSYKNRLGQYDGEVIMAYFNRDDIIRLSDDDIEDADKFIDKYHIANTNNNNHNNKINRNSRKSMVADDFSEEDDNEQIIKRKRLQLNQDYYMSSTDWDDTDTDSDDDDDDIYI